MAYYILVVWIIFLKYVKSQEIWDPKTPFIENDAEKERVQLGEYVNGNQLIYMDENIKENIIIAFLAYSGGAEPKITKFTEPSTSSNEDLGAKFGRTSSEEKWGLIVTMEQDYEGKSPGFRYAFDITIKDVTHRVYLYLNNLDDNEPIIQVLNNRCEVEENRVGISNCVYIISDVDGIMNNEVHYFLTGPAGEEAAFEIKNEIDLVNELQEWTVVLNILECLDFESISLYLLDFTVQDSGKNEATVKLVINVIDMPDNPPVWRNIFSSQQFDEKTEQTFQVEAVDGDVMINNPINYEIISDDPTLFKIEKETGKITVEKIDRDKLQKQIFTFEVKAFEQPDPTAFVTQRVSIIVNDVNDNRPSITVEPEDISIPENTATKLEFKIQIEDMDLGENGTYKVSLRDDTGNNYHTAFQIVPDEGYQLGKFTISVVNSTLLDYEVPSWQNIIINIFAQEIALEEHFDSKTIKISLENLNDEIPYFETETYTCIHPEDIGKDEFIFTVFADDRDIDDNVTHALVGKATKELFWINETTGEIRTLVANAFDYEKETEVIIQVQATDNLHNVHHRVTAQLVVTVTDVNDEPPSITVPPTEISVKENEKHGTLVNGEITATDEDTTADLKFEINWEESYAQKNRQNVSKEHYEWAIVVTTVSMFYSGHVRAELTINDPKENGDALDYEKMDKLYIALIVEDLDQKILPKTDKVMITINIVDVNDNAPIFDEDSITATKRVTEHASKDSTIATVFATDADGPEHNTIIYSISPLDDTTPNDWIAIHPVRGELTVQADEEIDADGDLDIGRPPIWKLSYIVTALNKKLNATAIIHIDVIDINDNAPIITVFQKVVKIHEVSPNDTDVQTISITDADRDAAYNTPWFQFTSVNDEIKDFFSIDSRSGRVYVHYKDNNKVLDRDKGTSTFSIPLIIEDNHGADGRQNVIYDTFTIILLDINNQCPTINDESERVSTSEKAKEGELLGTVLAFDDDEPGTDNTKINFTILSIEKGEEGIKDPTLDLFTISTDEHYISGKGHLKAGSNLREFYGIYTVVIETNDFGVYPGQLDNNKTIYVDIAKYNFLQPEIIYPPDNAEIYLQEEQPLRVPLIQYDGQELPLFSAKDSQNEKWDIIFKIDGAFDDVFAMVPATKSKARLVLITQPTDVAYRLKIVADCNCIGEEPHTNSVTINIRFISENSEPYFDDKEISEDFPENDTGLDIRKQLPKAYFKQGEEWDQFKIYYELKEDSSNCFKVGAETAILKLETMLDREEQGNHTLKIAASKNEAGNKNPDENSILTVFIKVIDVNDNPPNFDEPLYYGSIKPSDGLDTVILTATATDLDFNDTMTFSMVEESFTANGNGIDNIEDPFDYKTEGKMYKILLKFTVQSNMNGYFLFDITVTDAALQSHTVPVKIYIVSDSSRTVFKYENNIIDVEPKRDTIKNILEEQFSYICNIDTVQKGTDEDGVPLDTETDVIMHFINPINNEPIDSTEIELMTSDIEVFPKLKQNFLKEGLYLLSFMDAPSEENMEEILRACLIGVSVILGTLCTALIIAFIVKTRSLMKRLNNLSTTKFGSQDSGLNRMGIAAPNTNKHAIEGSNPVYNEEKSMANIDTASIGSGDSDLIGIEDNPNFQYSPEINQDSTNFTWTDKQ